MLRFFAGYFGGLALATVGVLVLIYSVFGLDSWRSAAGCVLGFVITLLGGFLQEWSIATNKDGE